MVLVRRPASTRSSGGYTRNAVHPRRVMLGLPGRADGVGMAARMTEDYLRSVGRLAYLWGWPLVNMRNRLSIMEKLPGPGLLGGIAPGRLAGQRGDAA